MGTHRVDYDEDNSYEDDDIDLDITELDEDEIFIYPSIVSLDKTTKAIGSIDKSYLAFLKKYFSSFFARKMVSSFNKVTTDNQVLCTNTSGSLLNESSSGHLAVALHTFKSNHNHLNTLFKDLLLENTRSMYLYKVTAYISLLNKYKEKLKVKRYNNTTIVAIGSDNETIDKKNHIAILITSQFIMKNVENIYNYVANFQNRVNSNQYITIDLDTTKFKHVASYVWYPFNLGVFGDQFKDCKQEMTLVWLDGMDLPSISEFLNKQKNKYRLQLVANVVNNKYIKYGVEYEDDEVLCTMTRPNMILYPNVLRTTK